MDAITPPSIKERPVIFSAAMVRAILEGRKTQTRRIIKPQPPAPSYEPSWTICSTRKKDEGKLHFMTFDRSRGFPDPIDCSQPYIKCPYSQPGDRLWVRETFKPCDCGHAICRGAVWAADFVEPKIEKGWKPSIHMPRWASRLLLEVVSVRVERLQDIYPEDAEAEGIQLSDRPGYSHMVELPSGGRWHRKNAVAAFTDLWTDINGAESWSANPWVWVVEFKRVDSNV